MDVSVSSSISKALVEVLAGHNNVIILGQAGTGQSFAIREANRPLVEQSKTVSVTLTAASTGIAATQCTNGGGQSIVGLVFWMDASPTLKQLKECWGSRTFPNGSKQQMC